MSIEKNELNKIMESMPIDWRYYWCDSIFCACSGCANSSGGLNKNGVKKEDWTKWVEENPKPK